MAVQQDQESLSMIERVARAILKRRYYDCEPEVYGNDVDGFMWKLDPDHLIDAHEEARAAIEAMREPTEAMERAGDDVRDQSNWSNTCSVWSAMIDAAIKEQP